MEQAPKTPEATPPKSKKTMYAVLGAIVIIIVIVAALFLAGVLPGGSSSPGTPVKVYNTGSASCTSVSTCGYTPTPLSISVGAKVTWTSNTTTPHTVTACSTANALDTTFCPTANGSTLPSFDSGGAGFTNGQTFSYTFSAAGTYYYACRIHYWMHAQVNVS